MKTLIWMESSKKDILEFPNIVRKKIAYALYVAQEGDIHKSAKLYKDHGPGIYNITINYKTDTYCTIYEATLEKLHVLHTCQKKSKKSLKRTEEEKNIIEKQLKFLRGTTKNIKEIEITPSSGNVFEDLNISNACIYLNKAQLAREINLLMQEKNLLQKQAATLLVVDQPKISALVNGQLSEFSMIRLYRFLTRLGQNISIVIDNPLATIAHSKYISKNKKYDEEEKHEKHLAEIRDLYGKIQKRTSPLRHINSRPNSLVPGHIKIFELLNLLKERK